MKVASLGVSSGWITVDKRTPRIGESSAQMTFQAHGQAGSQYPCIQSASKLSSPVSRSQRYERSPTVPSLSSSPSLRRSLSQQKYLSSIEIKRACQLVSPTHQHPKHRPSRSSSRETPFRPGLDHKRRLSLHIVLLHVESCHLHIQ